MVHHLNDMINDRDHSNNKLQNYEDSTEKNCKPGNIKDY